MTNRLRKNILYGTLTVIGYFSLIGSFTSQDFYVFGEWAGASTVTITALASFALFIFSLVMWCSHKK